MKKFRLAFFAALILVGSTTVSAQEVEPLEPDNYTLEQVVEFKKLAEQGDKLAQFRLGLAYAEGLGGLEINNQLAAEWYQKSSDQGYAKSTRNLGMMYAYGNLEQDFEKAKALYEKALQQNPNEPGSKRELAYLYLDGYGVPQPDVKKAVELLTQATEANDTYALVSLGDIYAEGEEPIAQDLVKAFNLYEKAAKLGSMDGQYSLAYHYYRGKGVEQNLKTAFEWYQKAAEQGSSGAQVQVGYMYDMGEGVEKDLKQAFEWYTKAAAQNDPDGLHNLAEMYRYGDYVKKDLEKAKEYYAAACQLDDEESCTEYQELENPKSDSKDKLKMLKKLLTPRK